jgi:hypothetical protein
VVAETVDDREVALGGEPYDLRCVGLGKRAVESDQSLRFALRSGRECGLKIFRSMRPCPTTEAENVIVESVLLGTRPAPGVWRVRSAAEKDIVLKPEPVLRLSSLLMVRDAVLAGAGHLLTVTTKRQSAAALPR